MSHPEFRAFANYARAFEESFASDDWKAVEDLMTSDIVWKLTGLPAPLAGVFNGPKAVIAAVKKSVDSLDRRFDLREPRVTEGPTLIPGGVHLAWEVTYIRQGLPEFVLRGEEWDLFHEGKLELHFEHIRNLSELHDYLEHNDAKLLPAR